MISLSEWRKIEAMFHEVKIMVLQRDLAREIESEIPAEEDVAVAREDADTEVLSRIAALETKVNSAASKNPVLEEPVIATIRDVFGNIVLQMTPGAAVSVNNLIISSSGEGGVLTISAVGADDDLDINFEPKGAGKLTVGGTPVALEP